MIRDWLAVGFVFAVLWIFWLWLGVLFDAISDYHHHYSSSRERREDMSPDKERGSS